MREKMQRGMVRAYLAYKRAISNIKGSPTMEYVVIIGVGALFASILYAIFEAASEGDGEIKNTLMEKVKNYIDGAGPDQGNSGNNGDNN